MLGFFIKWNNLLLVFSIACLISCEKSAFIAVPLYMLRSVSVSKILPLILLTKTVVILSCPQAFLGFSYLVFISLLKYKEYFSLSLILMSGILCACNASLSIEISFPNYVTHFWKALDTDSVVNISFQSAVARILFNLLQFSLISWNLSSVLFGFWHFTQRTVARWSVTSVSVT